MITRVDGPTAAAHSGRSPCCSDQVSLASVSVLIPVCSALSRIEQVFGPQSTARADLPEPGSIFDAGMPFGPWGALVYFAGIAAALLVAALWMANRRDA